MTINEFITGVTQNISNQTQPKSIKTGIVGGAFVDLATIVSGTSVNLTDYYTKEQSGALFLTGLTSQDGISISTANTIGLGGVLEHNILIDQNGTAQFVVEDVSTLSSFFKIIPGGTPNISTGIKVTLSGSDIEESSFNISQSGMLIIDNINKMGLLNNADYTISGNTNPRSIPDRGWVNNQISSFFAGRYSTTAKNALTGITEGTMAYDLTLHKLSVFTGAVWETVSST